MAIHRLLQASTFSPDEAANMTAAYEAALVLLHLDDRNDPITERIAEKIISVARSGAHNPAHICALAINELGLPVPDRSLAAHEQVKPQRSSFRWREALVLLVIGAFCGYVFAQMNKATDHAAVLARCNLQEQTPERRQLCMRAAGYEFFDTQCEDAEIVFEGRRLVNAAEINAARLAVLDPFIEQYLLKHPGQSRTMAELMVRDTAKDEIEKHRPPPRYEDVASCYKRPKWKAAGSN
jgi:hypothetical protein